MKEWLFLDNILLFDILFEVKEFIIENIIIFRKEAINLLSLCWILIISAIIPKTRIGII